MTITLSIVAIIALIIFILFYMKEHEKCKTLKYDNEKLKKEAAQRSVANAASHSEYDGWVLIIEAIQDNGFVPEADGTWIYFKRRGEMYRVDTGHLPMFIIMRHYDLDKNEWDMELLHQAAHKVSDEIVMAKVLFTGEDEDGISFQLISFEDDYGHLKDFLCRYLNIIDESYSRLFDAYDELEKRRSEALPTDHRLSLNMTDSKKVVS